MSSSKSRSLGPDKAPRSALPAHSSTTVGTRPRRPARGRSAHQPPRPRDWSGHTDEAVLARLVPGKADPLHVLEVLVRLYNERHTARLKSVSHKTRQERADFLRRFFRDLKERAGFKLLPDPRNLGQKHIHAAVQLWRQDGLKPATIQTYLSFLRGLAQWTGKPGFVRKPAHYGLQLADYQRREAAERDKSWSAQGLDIDCLLDQVSAYDTHVGASLRVIRAFGLRRKESVMLRPHACVVPFEATGLPECERQGDTYLWIRQGAKNGRQRFLPLNTPQRQAALARAQAVAQDAEDHLGDPRWDLKHNLKRFDYVLRKFGITARHLGITAHGLRHEALIEAYVAQTGQQPPVRNGAAVGAQAEASARLAVSKLAGHSRPRASAAYLGAVMNRRKSNPGPA